MFRVSQNFQNTHQKLQIFHFTILFTFFYNFLAYLLKTLTLSLQGFSSSCYPFEHIKFILLTKDEKTQISIHRLNVYFSFYFVENQSCGKSGFPSLHRRQKHSIFDCGVRKIIQTKQVFFCYFLPFSCQVCFCVIFCCEVFNVTADVDKTE